MSEQVEYTGPVRPTPEKLPAVVALANEVFRTDRPLDMSVEYPQLFGPGRTDNLRIIEAGGRPVSLVGMIIDDVTLCGCRLRVASIGSVCTDANHRGHGLAGLLMDDVVMRATDSGAALMLISGGRTLYARRGAWGEGRFGKYRLAADLLPQSDPALVVERVKGDDCTTALRMFEHEPIRFLRTDADYTLQIATQFSQNRPAATYLIRRGEQAAAVVTASMFALPAKDEPPTVRIVEYAGARPAVVASLRAIAAEFEAEHVSIDAYESDCAMADALAATAAEARKIVGFGGTIKLLSAERLWRDFGPLICERIGPDAYERISIASESDDLKIHTLTAELASQTVTIEGDREILAALLGSPQLDPLAENKGKLAKLLRRALPLPAPLYGMNYI